LFAQAAAGSPPLPPAQRPETASALALQPGPSRRQRSADEYPVLQFSRSGEEDHRRH
jgi:hypothetical protein